SITWFFGYSIIASWLFGISDLASFLSFFSKLLLANLISVAFIVFFVSGLAILTHQKGLDPDNYIIPLVSTLADAVTSLALLFAILLLVRSYTSGKMLLKIFNGIQLYHCIIASVQDGS
ncbi:MAG: magnesium transporter, partial [Candidatus Thorarchaeota archaeon]|nr:magnesium transporter [Candidatus Thorarchaeota archaeon]